MSYPEQQLLSGFNNQNVMNDRGKAMDDLLNFEG